MAATSVDDLGRPEASAAISKPSARSVPAMPARSIGVPSATTPIGGSGGIARMVPVEHRRATSWWAARDSNPEPTG